MLFVGVLVGAMWYRVNNAAPLAKAVVERVIDGDTIDVLIDQQRMRIRLEGIDAPELSQGNGPLAKQFLASYIQGYSVDIKLGDNDAHGRTLGEVYMVAIDIDTKQQSLLSVNELLVQSGHAWAYRYGDHVDKSKYGALETRARSEKRGLWVHAAAIAPWQWRQSHEKQ